MAVTSVQLMAGGRSSSINEKLERTYTRQYLVISNNVLDSEYLIRTNLGISLYSGHPDDAAARVKSIRVEGPESINGATGGKWTATVEWGLISPIESASSGDPVDQTPEIVIEGINYEKIAEKDFVSTNPIVNSAGDPFDPPVVVDSQRGVIKIGINVHGVPVTTVTSWANKVNDATWRGFAAKTLKVSQPRVTPHYSQFLDAIYSRVEITLDFRPETWQAKLLDQGYRSFDGSKQHEIVIDGVPAQKPVPLSSGVVVTPPITNTNASYLTFDVYDVLSFSTIDTALSLPTTLWT